MKKVVCVKNINEEGILLSLTLGKVYDYIGSDTNTFCVKNDKGDKVTYLSDRFKHLKEVRNERIDELLKW